MRITNEDMNLLQDVGGIIADNCVTWEDVAEVDRPAALQYLEMFKVRTPMELL